MKSVYNKISRVATSTPNLNLANLLDVSAATAVNSQGLVYLNGKWTNQNIVNSVFGRTGTVVATTGDYNISQITGTSPLASSTNVSITSPANGQLIMYNGTNYINSKIYNTYPIFSYNPGSITCALDTYYINGTTATFTIPSCGLGDAGRQITIVSSQGVQTSITFPTGIFLVYEAGYQNFTMNSPENGMIEFIVVSSNQYTIGRCSGNWFSPIISNKPFNATFQTLANCQDTVITSPTNGQVLSYNGSKWVNTTGGSGGGVSSVSLTVPSDLSVSGSPITTAGTLAITRNSEAANLFLASPNGSAGIPTYRSIVSADLPTANNYYNVVYTSTTSISPAIKNTHYVMSFGGTLTVAPLNQGEHLMITAEANTITVNFTGTSFITNSYLGGGTPNPSFILTYATIELICTLNSGQTYYDIVRVSQNRSGAVCTLNSTKISALSELNDVPDVLISAPTNGQVLSYNGSQWINSSSSSATQLMVFNSNGNIYSGGYICIQNFSGDSRLAQIIIPRACTFSSIAGYVSVITASGSGWTITIYKNGSSTGATLSLTTGTAYLKTTVSVAFAAGDRLSLYVQEVGGAAIPALYATLEYN